MAEQWEVGWSSWNIIKAPPVPIGADNRFALPQAFTAFGERGQVRAEIDVEMADGRARARRVRVESTAPRGLSSTALRSVPVLDIIAAGARGLLHEIAWDKDTKTATLTPVDHTGKARLKKDALEALRSAVPFAEVKP